jgi:hypothetical protein
VRGKYQEAACHAQFRQHHDLVGRGDRQVDEQHREDGEPGQQQRHDPGMPAEQHQAATADLEHDHERQQQARHAACGHVSLRARVASDFAEAGNHEQQDQEKPAEQIGTVGERFHVEPPVVGLR